MSTASIAIAIAIAIVRNFPALSRRVLPLRLSGGRRD